MIIGNNFHSMGASLEVQKPVVLVDVYNDAVTEMTGVREMILKQRAISIQNFKDAKKIGIISEHKLGQKFGNAEELVEKLKKNGKEVLLITMNELTPDKLMNFYDINAFIELACPRIAIDDFAKYGKPILTFKEALVAIDELSWEDLYKGGFIKLFCPSV